MEKLKISKLNKISLRKCWENEERDFSPWLSDPINLKLLADKIEFDFDPDSIQREVDVGGFQADILLKEQYTNKFILIENQYNRTDHSHLGEIITYAAGLKASKVIWITEEIHDQHRRAIEWLNSISNGDVSFYLVKLELLQIEGSKDVAPNFDVIESPNNFTNEVKSRISDPSSLNFSETKRLSFWEKFNDWLSKNNLKKYVKKPTIDHWRTIGLGTSKYDISIDLLSRQHKIRINFNIRDEKFHVDEFLRIKEIFDKNKSIIDFETEWREMSDSKYSQISTYIDNLDFENENTFNNLFPKTIEIIEKFEKFYKKISSK